MDVAAATVKSLTRSFELLRKDLEALPEGAFTHKFGPKTRTVADIVFEINLVNERVAREIRQEPAMEWPDDDWIRAPEGFDTKEVVLGALNDSASGLGTLAESFTSEQLVEAIAGSGRTETTRVDRFRFIVLHNWYHSGQLNFIQTLIGDDGWHWE